MGPALIPRSARPPIWREARFGLEAASLLRDPIFRGVGLNDGRGRPVLLIPGFLAGDGSLGVMANWLKRANYRPTRAGIRANVDCAGALLERLEQRLEPIVAEQGRRAAIVGQSRGGGLAKVLAHRRPDLVCGIVALGSPHARATRDPSTREAAGRGRRTARHARRAGILQARLPRGRLLCRLLGATRRAPPRRRRLRVGLFVQ